MKKLFVKIGTRLLMLLLIFTVLNWIYVQWFLESDLQKHAEIVNLVREIPEDTEILYFGESSNNTFIGEDLDKRAISDFIAAHFPGIKTFDVTKPAAHAGIYRVLLDHLPTNNKNKTLIITVNLRSFNAQWLYSDLETALQKSLVLLKPYPALYNRFMLSFKGYDLKTPEERAVQIKRKWKHDIYHFTHDFPFNNVLEWDAHIHKNGVLNAEGSLNDSLTTLTSNYVKAFGFQIDFQNHPRVKDLDAIVEWANKHGMQLVFNILAENTEKAEQLVGKAMVDMMQDNASKLEKYYSQKGVLVVNNLNAVPDSAFMDKNWTTEHYTEQGRRVIAQNVARAIKKFYPENFKPLNNETRIQMSFFNDCEGKERWSQSHTYTEQRSFSGKKSSLVFRKQDCSVTWEYPFRIVPDSLKKSLLVELMFYQTYTLDEAVLVIDLKLDSGGNDWQGFRLNEFPKAQNRWVKFSKIIPIDAAWQTAKLIKVYVYNSSKHKLYVDDFHVEILPN